MWLAAGGIPLSAIQRYFPIWALFTRVILRVAPGTCTSAKKWKLHFTNFYPTNLWALHVRKNLELKFKINTNKVGKLRSKIINHAIMVGGDNSSNLILINWKYVCFVYVILFHLFTEALAKTCKCTESFKGLNLFLETARCLWISPKRKDWKVYLKSKL